MTASHSDLAGQWPLLHRPDGLQMSFARSGSAARFGSAWPLSSRLAWSLTRINGGPGGVVGEATFPRRVSLLVGRDLDVSMIVFVQFGQMLQNGILLSGGRIGSDDTGCSGSSLSGAGGLDGELGGIITVVGNIGPSGSGHRGGVWYNFNLWHRSWLNLEVEDDEEPSKEGFNYSIIVLVWLYGLCDDEYDGSSRK